MAISADWIAQNTATTGTGTITLGTALTGFIRLQDDSRITDGALVNYTIEDGNDREMGIGTYASAGGTLARTVVQRTLVSGTYDDTSPTAISLSGNAVVRCSAVADDRNFRGAWVGLTAAQSIPNGGSGTIINWTTEVYDIGGWHDNVTNNSRLTVPAGVSKVRLSANGWWAISSSGTLRLLDIRKNGVTTTIQSRMSPTLVRAASMIVTSVLEVEAGDYFELSVYQDSGGAIDFGYNGADYVSFFSIEAVE